MTVMARTSVACLQVGDAVILAGGGEVFVVVGAGEPVGRVRQLDVVRAGADGPHVRLTLSLDHRVRLG